MSNGDSHSGGGTLNVVVTNIRMPFLSMVIFIIKWTIASIPAMIILMIIFLIVTTLLGGVFQGLGLTTGR
ncbi:MAG: hypothetical protein AAF495_03960 [Pseudomonadota bacterium]